MHVSGRCWRIVEAQNRISTTKLTDNPQEQRILELIVERTKPPVPAECQHLNFLLWTPFRYGAPYPRGSRFRRAGLTPGVFYASDEPTTAVAELCFHRLLFFSESPQTRWPQDAGEYAAFAADYSANSINLANAPFNDRSAFWTHPTRYDECQPLADVARNATIDAIRYASVRDPGRRLNVAMLTCRPFTTPEPVGRQTWRLLFGSEGARALCEMPAENLIFDRAAFATDPRIAAMRWER